MSWLLFIDESGQDRRQSPYEVLAGIAVEDRVLWRLIRQLTDSQIHHFGIARYREFEDEAKAKKLLKAKTFRLAGQGEAISHQQRQTLALQALRDGQNATREQLTALGQAKIAYCQHVLRICRDHGCVAFASIVPNTIARPSGEFLRKDYSFLFERYFHFLNSRPDRPMGIVVFDELEKSKSHILVTQMHEYFVRTHNGRTRSRLVIPEPLFVHSDMTTMIQIADIIAYVVCWSVRLRYMTASARSELQPLAREVLRMRYWHETPGGHTTWGFKLIRNLEPGNT